VGGQARKLLPQDKQLVRIFEHECKEGLNPAQSNPAKKKNGGRPISRRKDLRKREGNWKGWLGDQKHEGEKQKNSLSAHKVSRPLANPTGTLWQQREVQRVRAVQPLGSVGGEVKRRGTLGKSFLPAMGEMWEEKKGNNKCVQGMVRYGKNSMTTPKYSISGRKGPLRGADNPHGREEN